MMVAIHNEENLLFSQVQAHAITKEIKDITKDIPDNWDISKFSEDQANTFTLPLQKIRLSFRDIVKYHLWAELFERALSASTVVGEFYNIFDFIVYLEETYGVVSIESIQERHWIDYLQWVQQKVSDGELLRYSAYTKTLHVYSFLGTLDSIELINVKWSRNYDLYRIFMVDYKQRLTSKEINELEKTERERKLKRVILYSDLISIMESVYADKNIYFRTATIIMAHTGLRLVEVMNLTEDCIHPVDKEMAKTASDFLIRYGGHGGIVPDWSESYWLTNYKTAKIKKKAWSAGTPILVSKTVYDAIQQLLEFTRPFRIESGRNELFLRRFRGEIGVIRKSFIQKYRRALIVRADLPWYTEHQLRHTFATILYDDHVPLSYIKKYLNHLSDDMTATYTHSNEQKKKQGYKKFFSGGLILSGVDNGVMAKVKEEILEAESSELWSSWTVGQRLELFEFVLKRNNISISIMGHGACLLPTGEVCPNNFGGVDACYLTNCVHFTPTEESIPFFADLINNADKAILELERIGMSNVEHIISKIQCDKQKIQYQLQRIS